MNALELRAQLIQLIEKEKDPTLLDRAIRLFKNAGRNDALKEEMLQRAKQSNDDIRAGRVVDLDEVVRRTDALLAGK